MAQVSATSTILINVDPAATLAALADYQNVRPKILSPHYSEYQVLQGGQGQGTVVKWKLQATKSRSRNVQANVDVAGHSVIVKTSWTGAGGVKGFFEKTFAPLGLKKIQGEVLANLKKELES